MTPKPDTIVAVMNGVREHVEGHPVTLVCDGQSDRLVVHTFAEGNQNKVDVEDLVRWLYAHEPNLLVLQR